MKVRLLTVLLTISISTNVLCAQSIPKTVESQLLRAKKSVNEQFNKLKKCIAGKEPCSKLDFAILGSSILFLYAIFTGLRFGLYGQHNPDEFSPSELVYHLDPFFMTIKKTHDISYAAKRKIQQLRKPNIIIE